jgi:hypothetical protein
MTRSPDDRSDKGPTAELREQLEEDAEEARRLAALVLEQGSPLVPGVGERPGRSMPWRGTISGNVRNNPQGA